MGGEPQKSQKELKMSPFHYKTAWAPSYCNCPYICSLLQNTVELTHLRYFTILIFFTFTSYTLFSLTLPPPFHHFPMAGKKRASRSGPSTCTNNKNNKFELSTSQPLYSPQVAPTSLATKTTPTNISIHIPTQKKLV